MSVPAWAEEFGGAITVCDADGVIIDMNRKAAEVFAKYGGAALIGKSLFDCHSPASREKLQTIMQTRATNVYTIEKNGAKKLIYQAPWYKGGEFAGLVDISVELPANMPHFVRE